MIHSPFHVVEDFISPLQCEKLIQRLALKVPNRDDTGNALKYEHKLVSGETVGRIFSELEALTPIIEKRYNGLVSGDFNVLFQQYPENPNEPAEQHAAEGWKFLRKKWTKFRDVDLVGFLWLKSFHAAVPLDPRYEVYGGKLEFPAYNFSLTPERGTLVLFPATPHFVHAISHVMLGTLEQIKISVKLRANEGASWSYDPSHFPGTYQEWFVKD